MLISKPLIQKNWNILVLSTLTLILCAGISATDAFARLPSEASGEVSSQPSKYENYPIQTSTPPPACGLAWRTVASPNAAGRSNVLNDIEAVEPDNVWAVGHSGDTAIVFGGRTLIQNWNGTQWSIVPSPSPGTYDRLMGIDVVSPTDIWAVGNTDTQTLTMHWNGTQWSIVPSPSVNGTSNRLMGVAAVSANDVWAVGYHGTNTGNSQTLILHWNGTQWSIEPSPNVGTIENELYDVTAIAANDVWAVGRIGSWGSRERTLTLHWDGISWSVVSNPNPTGEFTPYALYGIDALASNDVWAVGVNRNNSWSRTLIERWNGTQWSIVPSPNANLNGDNELHAVSVLSASDIWAVGFYLDNGVSGDYRTLIMHWDGTQWSIVPSPYPGSFNNRLFGVEAVSPGDVWSVGYAGTTYEDVSSLVTRYSDPCLTPTPSATGTPPTATSTNTPTATPACTLGWSVVASPNFGSGPNQLKAVAAMTSENMWAVGYYNNVNGVEQTLIMHWDGTQWSTVPSPNVGSLNNRLTGVDVVSANDAWAVGYYRHSDGQDRTLMLRWDGSSWNVISSPAPGNFENRLYAVEALSANDVWAVGRYRDNNGGRALTMRWDGATWTVVPSHPGGAYGGSTLLAIDALAPNDIWAVGTDQNGPYPDTLTLHWNGSQWATVQSPSPGSQYEDALTGVSVLSSNDVWATGYNFFNGTVRTLTLHWNGTAWSVVSSPNFGLGRNALYGAAGTESGEVWAVGEYVASGVTQTLVLRWNGANWGITSSPNAGSLNNTLYGVAAVRGEVWTVGHYANGDNIPRTLVERYRAVCNTPVPTITPTNTPTPTSVGGTPTTTNTPTATCGPAWQVVSSPNVGSADNILTGVSVISSADIWAVGYHGSYPYHQTFTMHWDGTQWNVVPSPNPAANENVLYAVAAVSINDVWAVGATGDYTLALHWDGTSWTQVPTPNPGTGGDFLFDVDVISSNDIWAVGYYNGPGPNQTLVLHWNGSSWAHVPTPNPGASSSILGAIAAVSSNDVWAVGSFNNGGPNQTLVLHWDGGQWNTVSSPNIGTEHNVLSGIDVVSGNDIWAVGHYIGGSRAYTLILRWNGAGWTIVPSPDPGHSNYLNRVTAISNNDVWAVGSYLAGGPSRALILHWDGSSWNEVPGADLGNSSHTLKDVNGLSNNDLWVVGYEGSIPGRTLIERYHNPCITPTTSPTNIVTSTPTNTPTIVPTNTATAVSTGTRTNTAIVTPIATATACSLEFDDVAPGSTFYEFVRCLACRGIISGYSDSTFRPNNQVTRGQLAKIVSNAAGFAEDPNPQIFEDVAPGSTFYEWINRLTRRGYMSGYLCGGAGEPCVNGDRPYFRPGANATRGQTSKIVANTAQFIEEPTEQTFEDVPLTHTFYREIQRLASRNIMGGYPCGGPNEPCLSGKPYFRPSNNVTRGQSAKIVANTFYPDCQTP